MTRIRPRFGPDSDGFAELRALIAFHHVPEVPDVAEGRDAVASGEPGPNGQRPEEPVIAPGLDLTAALAELAAVDRAIHDLAEPPAPAEPPAEQVTEAAVAEPADPEPPVVEELVVEHAAPAGSVAEDPVVEDPVVEDPVVESAVAAPEQKKRERAPKLERVPRARKGQEDAGIGLFDLSAPPVLAPPPVLESPRVQTPFEESAEGPDVMAIVARAQAGDAVAFGELYDRYVDLIYRYIYYRVGTQTLTEDLVSETFLRALRRISSFSWQGRDFAAWLVTIARNLIADHFKSGRYRLEIATADMLEADRAQDGPEGEVLDAMTNERLITAVKQLNSEQQECVVLRFLQGMSVTETALAMGKTEGAIKALQYRAVRSLARLLPRELVQ